MSLEMCHLLIRKRAQICDRCSLEYFAMLRRFHSLGRTHDAGSVTRIAFKYKRTGFRMNFLKKFFSVVILCLFIHNSRSMHSRKTTAQASLQ